ncbi:hypothetical protein [Phaeodactylibacter xiamenensis]|uniref:hypothetical protein n=1 Tax=Phaeodactylibacter xiamenensis TaxID=1524460 RepID=UPI0024A8C740|nr:hypothetical protein [Phaeodactylibacter xiamenensis]
MNVLKFIVPFWQNTQDFLNLVLKKNILLVFIFLCISTASFSQLTDCTVVEGTQQSPLNSTNTCIPDPANLESFPIKTVRINIHFILRNDGTGNFKEPGNNLPGEIDGVAAANQLVGFMNSRLKDFTEYTLSLNAYHIPDSRIRFELYSEPNHPSDPYDGVHFVYSTNDFNATRDNINLLDLKNNYSVYGDDVIDIFMNEDVNANGGFTCCSGKARRPGNVNVVVGMGFVA